MKSDGKQDVAASQLVTYMGFMLMANSRVDPTKSFTVSTCSVTQACPSLLWQVWLDGRSMQWVERALENVDSCVPVLYPPQRTDSLVRGVKPC